MSVFGVFLSIAGACVGSALTEADAVAAAAAAAAACGGARVLGRFRGGDLSDESSIGVGGLSGRLEGVLMGVCSVIALLYLYRHV